MVIKFLFAVLGAHDATLGLVSFFLIVEMNQAQFQLYSSQRDWGDKLCNVKEIINVCVRHNNGTKEGEINLEGSR